MRARLKLIVYAMLTVVCAMVEAWLLWKGFNPQARLYNAHVQSVLDSLHASTQDLLMILVLLAAIATGTASYQAYCKFIDLVDAHTANKTAENVIYATLTTQPLALIAFILVRSQGYESIVLCVLLDAFIVSATIIDGMFPYALSCRFKYSTDEE
ncbi:hypothetical protein GCM10007377_15380 [Galliscardovia ingluviei]|uniref:Uncharacterized protein n=1 Tax=Galliscardovia ingluviei TaxID=1769422 RepID=A0A8J3EZV5_9BIFI|nr:hypothetical protein [Galliscardovia ingluviei]GGI15334.1 hypothetical protein GCM10007377_15380 [Galliscardovia ingluviei]